jgi:hypothetical protein
MESVIGLMEESVVLSAQDILRFRQYIDRKYANDTSRIKAEILADVIHRMVEPHLEGIERSCRKTLKTALFTNTIAQQKDQISKKDIFAELVLLELDETILVENAWRWLKVNVWTQIAYEAALDLVNGLRSPSLDVAQPLSEEFALSDTSIPKRSGVQRYLLSGVMGISILTLGIWSWQSNQMATLSTPSTVTVDMSNREVDVVPSHRIEQVFEESVLSEVSKTDQSNKTTQKLQVHTPTQAVSMGHMFSYVSFNEENLRVYLVKKNSLLAEAPYFETIMNTAKDHDIDPRLLFAIAGQEQGLVNKNKSYALKAANNPFNVYGSWVKYNTSIEDSSEIVCNTLVKRLSKKPKHMDALAWINKKYASDPNWSRGVKRYYKQLVAVSR